MAGERRVQETKQRYGRDLNGPCLKHRISSRRSSAAAVRRRTKASMRVVLALALLLGLLLAGCYRSVLLQREPCPPDPSGALPDLSVAVDTADQHLDHYFVNSKAVPFHVTTFVLIVRNVGRAPFDGRLILHFADRASDIAEDEYPVEGPRSDEKLPVGVPVRIRFNQNHWYDPGIVVKFLLTTDSNCFGCGRICEISYTNNVAQYVIH